MKDLDRDALGVAAVQRAVNDGHAASAEQRVDLPATKDLLADAVKQIFHRSWSSQNVRPEGSVVYFTSYNEQSRTAGHSMIRRKPSKIGIFALALAGFASASSRASAQPPAEAAKRAEVLFEEAREALVRGDYEVACPRFGESYRIDPAPGTLLNLGDCEERRGRPAAAWIAFRSAQRLLASTDKRAAYALSRAATLEPRLGRLMTTLPVGAPANVQISLDGEPLGSEAIGGTVAVLPGKHALIVRAPQRLDTRTELTIREGEARNVELVIGAEVLKTVARAGEPAPAAAPALRAKRPAGEPTPTLAYLSLGGGGALLITGVITGFMVLEDASTYRARCPDGYCNDGAGRSAARSSAS